MKQLLIATAALSLIGGAAFAQTAAATPGAEAPSGSTQGAQPGANTSTGTNDANAPNAANGETSSTQNMPAAPASNAAGMSSGSMASNTGADAPPASYPVCTSKHEDRCVNRSQATRMASNGMRHRMKHMSSSTMTTDSSPAATPSQ